MEKGKELEAAVQRWIAQFAGIMDTMRPVDSGRYSLCIEKGIPCVQKRIKDPSQVTVLIEVGQSDINQGLLCSKWSRLENTLRKKIKAGQIAPCPQKP